MRNNSTGWEIYKNDFQTPLEVAKYMCSLIPENTKTVLEPTPGKGNIARYLVDKYEVTLPEDYFLLNPTRYDCVVMNPPFSSKYANMENAPESFNAKGMKLGYYMLTECMKLSNNIIALMPWFTISDSDVRLRFLKAFGLKSITALPRKTFQFARIQTMVLELEKGFVGNTAFIVFDEITNENKLQSRLKFQD